MEDISKYLKHYLGQYRHSCPKYDTAEKECNRQGGCVCYKHAEILSTIRTLIPQEYRTANIFSFDGKTPDGNRVITRQAAEEIRRQLWGYLYRGEYQTSLGPDTPRSHLNALSILDNRFKQGTNLAIHGDQKKYNKRTTENLLSVKREPKGKTLLASVVMIDAIWRRISPNNIARTYDRISFLRLRQGLKRKDEYVQDAQDADWLIIDDICMMEKSSSSSWTKETLDDFVITRMAERKPTIFVFDFDITNAPLSDALGMGIAKVVDSHNTYKIHV